MENNEWISVDDKLPKFLQRVLIFDAKNGGRIDIVKLSEKKAIETVEGNEIILTWIEGNSSHEEYMYKPTHWQPLPSPPSTKEETESFEDFKRAREHEESGYSDRD